MCNGAVYSQAKQARMIPPQLDGSEMEAWQTRKMEKQFRGFRVQRIQNSTEIHRRQEKKKKTNSKTYKTCKHQKQNRVIFFYYMKKKQMKTHYEYLHNNNEDCLTTS